MRIEYKFCPNLTIIDTPGERAVLNGRKVCVLLPCSVQAGTSLMLCHQAMPDALLGLSQLQASSPRPPASATHRCRTAPSRCGASFGAHRLLRPVQPSCLV